jgi:hypothetical protein
MDINIEYRKIYKKNIKRLLFRWNGNKRITLTQKLKIRKHNATNIIINIRKNKSFKYKKYSI